MASVQSTASTQVAGGAQPTFNGSAELWVFRVEEGLGNACALIFPDGSGGVIDWGTARPEPLAQLLSLLQRAAPPRLRFVAATHPHADHTLGIEVLLERLTAAGVRIDRLVYPTPLGGPRENHLRNARNRAKSLGIPMSSVAVSTLPESAPAPVLALGSYSSELRRRWIVRVIAPHDTAIGNVEVQSERVGATPGNPTSLVLQFAFMQGDDTLNRGRAVLPGDATPATLNHARRRSREFPELTLVNDALVILHHGSKHNWVSWLENDIKGVAIVSAPSGREKHPSVTVLKHAVKICGSGDASRLHCTSYSGACFKAFVKSGVADAPRSSDACFGDIGIGLSPDAAPVLLQHDKDGPKRRTFGYCG